MSAHAGTGLPVGYNATCPSFAQGVEFLLDRSLDANKKRATYLRRISVAKSKLLKVRSDAALALSLQRDVQTAGIAALTSARGRKARARQERLVTASLGATKAKAVIAAAAEVTAKEMLAPEAQRALADVAAHNGDEKSGGRGDPYTAALYMKLCERYDGMGVAPGKLIEAGDGRALELFSSIKAQSVEVAKAMGTDPEGTVDVTAECEVLQQEIKKRKGGCMQCSAGSRNLFAKAKGAVESLEDPDSLNLLKRGWILRGFLGALWGSRVWFQHTYLSVFTKVRLPSVCPGVLHTCQ